MKEVLLYTEEELRQLSTEELNSLYHDAEQSESLYNTSQLVQKTLINSLYGALANRHFPLFNQDMARAITGNGRYFIKKMSSYIESLLQEKKSIDKTYVLYNDTDSVVGSTIVSTSTGDLSIENLYDKLNGKIDILGVDNFVKIVSNKVSTKSFNSSKREVEDKQIKHIMKHKVNKRMFKIKHLNDEVIVTEDHSVIVNRNGSYLDIKPADILGTDKIVKLSGKMNMIETSDFTIEDLGIQEQWVYDIEVDDNHNFFGNNILVHNSAYFTIEPMLEEHFRDKPDATLEDKVNWADEFYKTCVDTAVQRSIDDLASELNAYNKDVVGAEREIISDTGVFNAKKKYFMRVNDSEGVRYETPKMKVMGLEIIRSSTPPFSRKLLKESLNIILDSTPEEMLTWINDVVRVKFIESDLPYISGISGVSNMNYDLEKDKGIPIGARSSLVHNKYIRDNNLLGTFTEIQSGDKTKRLYLLEPNPLNSNIVAYTDDRFIEMFKDYVDYDTNFKKLFVAPLEIMTNALNWDLEKTTASLEDW